MATDRMIQIDALVKKELAIVLRDRFPDLFIAVTEVHVTKDLAHGKVWISSPIDSELALKKCRSEATSLRKYLASHIVARRVPALNFVVDSTQEKAFHIESLIKKIKEEE